jgi:hypothetical protein
MYVTIQRRIDDEDEGFASVVDPNSISGLGRGSSSRDLALRGGLLPLIHQHHLSSEFPTPSDAVDAVGSHPSVGAPVLNPNAWIKNERRVPLGRAPVPIHA